MALEKLMSSRCGVPANYWKVGFITDDSEKSLVLINLWGYESQESRWNGGDLRSGIRIEISESNYVPDMSKTDIYNYIKQLSEWSDAIDC